MKRTSIVLTAAACAALLVAGCGSSKKNESTSAQTQSTQTTTAKIQNEPTGGASAQGGKTLQLSADPSGQLKFDKDKLSAKAGKVTLEMSNPSDVPHAVAVKGNGIDKDGQTAQKGESSTVSVSLKAGTYEFYCPVDSHEQAGMKGTLTVK